MMAADGGSGVPVIGPAAPTSQEDPPVRSENVFIGDAEVVPLSEESLEARQRHEAILKQLEKEKLQRSLFVPTNDNAVRQRLRELTQPVCLFGEGPGERRDRLKSVMAQLAVEHGLPEPKINDEAMEDATAQTELFYTEGREALRKARRWIADYSLVRGRDRIKAGKVRRAELMDPEKMIEAHDEDDRVREELSHFGVCSSQIGDDRPISSCAFSPNGSMVATASWTGRARLWGVPTCENVGELRGHTSRVTGVTFHPQSCLSLDQGAANIATSSADNTAKLWALNNVFPLTTLVGHAARLSSLAFHPSGRFLGTTSYDLTWRLWDVETQRELLAQEGHSRPVYGISFQIDGSIVATSDLAGIARVWDLRTGKSILALEGHIKAILGVDFSPNGYILATGSEDNTVRIWDLRKRRAVYTIPAHSNLVSHIRFQPGAGTFLLTCSHDDTAKLWSTADWTLAKTLAGHEGKVMRGDVTEDGRYLATASYDRTWKLWAHEDLFLHS